MDCQTAQYELETLALREEDVATQASPDVNNHLKSCAQCKTYFSQLVSFDQSIAKSINTVSIPADLQSNILASLQKNHGLLANEGQRVLTKSRTSTDFNSLHESKQESSISRRRWIAMAGTSAAGLVAACSAWFTPNLSGNRLTLNEFRRWSGTTFSTAQAFRGVFTPVLPANRWQTGVVEFGSAFTGLRPNGSGRHTIASIGFSLNINRRTIDGAILMTPAQFVTDAPQINYFNPGEYVTLADHETSSAAWTESNLVFACCVRGNERQLEWIDRALSSAGPA